MKLQTESEHPVATCRRGEEKNCHCTPARRSRRRQSRDSRPHARPPATSIHLHARRRQCKGLQDQEHGIDTAAGGTRRCSGEPRRAAATAFLGGGRCLIYRPPPGYTPSVRWDLYGLDSAESSFSSSRGGPLAQEKAAERDFLSLAKTAGDGATGALSG